MGYARALASSTRYQSLGVSGGVGTTLTASATVNTKGSFAILGTTGFQYDGFHLHLTGLPGSGGSRFRVDVSSNTGGSDQLIVEDIYFDASSSGSYYQDQEGILVPVYVPAGAALKARVQGTAASTQISASILGFSGDAKSERGFRALKSTTDWTGTDPTNSITFSGITLTGWTQVQAVAPVRLAALYLAIDGLSNLSLVNAHV